MKINKNSLQARLNNLARQNNVHTNVLLVSFFFDAFMCRLARSVYCEKFVFKGGFYLSTLLGVQNRYTADIDFLLSRESLKVENLMSIFNEILQVDVDDSISFEIASVTPIRDEDAYGGFSILLTGRLENIRQNFHVDVATGDPITPGPVSYTYKCLLSDEKIKFRAYNLETIIAEKMQTILTRGALNSRSKDFYDIFIIQKLQWLNIDEQVLKEAFEKTCTYRETAIELDDANAMLEQIANSAMMQTRWKNYARKTSFAEKISFEDVMVACKRVLDKIYRQEK